MLGYHLMAMSQSRMWWAVSVILALGATAVILPASASAASAGSYEWKLSCKSAGEVFGYALWNWTAGGLAIAGAGGKVSFGFCGNILKLGGEGPRPGNADGLVASLQIFGGCLSTPAYLCSDGSSASWSFDPAKRFNAGLSVSFSTYEYWEGYSYKVSGSADWSLDSRGV